MKRRDRICIAIMAVAIAAFALYDFWLDDRLVSGPLAEDINMLVTRLLGAAVFFSVIVYMGYPVLHLSGGHGMRGVLLMLPFWAVALNNFPFCSVLSGSASLQGVPVWQYLLVAGEYIAVALFEESAFRGVLIPMLLQSEKKHRFPELRALVLSSAVFGLIHVVNLFAGASFGAVVMQIGYSFLIGGMCGIAFLYSKNIWTAVGLHALYDFCGKVTPTLGSGTVWTIPTVIATAVVGAVVGIYALILVYRLWVKPYMAA